MNASGTNISQHLQFTHSCHRHGNSHAAYGSSIGSKEVDKINGHGMICEGVLVEEPKALCKSGPKCGGAMLSDRNHTK